MSKCLNDDPEVPDIDKDKEIHGMWYVEEWGDQRRNGVDNLWR